MNNSFGMDEEDTRPIEAMPAQCLNITQRNEIDGHADDTSPLQEESVPLILAGGTSEAAIGDRATPTPEIAAGTRLRSRYILEEIIGRGGESVVFRARDLHRISSNGGAGIIAIRLLLPKHRANPRALERLRRAFWQMQSLTHPGIARVFDLDCDGDIWFMTIELVAGQTLNSWMQGAFSTADAVKLIAACCEALEHAHSKGILHGDLKPANVVVTENGGIKLIDFGSAPSAGGRMDEGRDPNAGTTPSYASPQVLLGSSPERCDDVFSLACLSYELLSRGGRPYADRSMLEARQEQMRPRYDPGIPLRLFQVIAGGLALERDLRPKTAREFLHRLTSAELGRNSNPAPDQMPVHCGLSASVTEEATRPPGIDPTVQLAPTEATLPPGIDPTVQLAPTEATLPHRNEEDRVPDEMPVHAGPSASVTDEATPPPGIDPPVQLPPTAVTLPHRNEEPAAGGPRTKTTVLVAGISRSDSRGKGRMRLLGLAVVILGIAVLALQALQSIVARPGESSRLAPVQIPQRVLALAPTLPPPSETVLPASSVVPAPARRAPRASGIITFDAAAITASAAQPVVAIVVRRLHVARGDATIVWQVEGGTARPGVDYERARPQVLKFFDGQTVRSLFIPLAKTSSAAATMRGSRSFTVVLRAVKGGGAIGPIARVLVTLLPVPPAIGSGPVKVAARD